RAGVESDRMLLRQADCGVYRQTVQVSERRHRAQFAIGKELPDFHLGCQAQVGSAQSAAQLLDVHDAVGWQYCHYESAIDHEDDSLGYFPAAHVLGLSHFPSREGGSMRGASERNAQVVQKIFNSFSNRHKLPSRVQITVVWPGIPRGADTEGNSQRVRDAGLPGAGCGTVCAIPGRRNAPEEQIGQGNMRCIFVIAPLPCAVNSPIVSCAAIPAGKVVLEMAATGPMRK